jgi:hypothetical protein
LSQYVHPTPHFEGVFHLDANWPGPVYPGFQPQHVVHDDYETSGSHAYPDRDCVYPGESACVEVCLITPHVYPHCLWVGRELAVRGGARVAGRLVVTRIFDASLEVAPEAYLPKWSPPPGLDR